MTNMALFAEHQVRADLARLLLAAVEVSGRAGGMDPPPIDFTDEARARERSLSSLSR